MSRPGRDTINFRWHYRPQESRRGSFSKGTVARSTRKGQTAKRWYRKERSGKGEKESERERKREEEELARSRSNESLLGVMTSILGQRRGE